MTDALSSRITHHVSRFTRHNLHPIPVRDYHPHRYIYKQPVLHHPRDTLYARSQRGRIVHARKPAIQKVITGVGPIGCPVRRLAKLRLAPQSDKLLPSATPTESHY